MKSSMSRPTIPITPRHVNAVCTLAEGLDVHLPRQGVCKDHCTPATFLADWIYNRPSLSLVLGPRGGGKSYLSALATHVESARNYNHHTKILGGSEAQSMQIFNALSDFDRVVSLPGDEGPSHDGDEEPDDDEDDEPRSPITKITATGVTYDTGSTASYIPASAKSVRGPHVPSLRLDEIDEIDPDIRESAFGMCMAKGDFTASVTMTSTWHRLGGEMEALLERGRAGEFPTYTFCIFDVLEPCPDERSGPNLENCPLCPLMKWCHADKDEHGRPKAKRANGHYTIDSLIQKVKAVSLRVFEADYLCTGPKADGVWFSRFNAADHVSENAEYDPSLPVYLGVDPGVQTGAVLFQIRTLADRSNRVNVFADYFAEGVTAEDNARAIRRVAERHCNGRVDMRYCDPAGGARNPIGPTVMDVYRASGLGLTPWASHNPSVADSLEMVEGLLASADGTASLQIHPRCVNLHRAFLAYRRAKRSHQFVDYPEDPQHPAEDLIDALRGALHARIKERIQVW